MASTAPLPRRIVPIRPTPSAFPQAPASVRGVIEEDVIAYLVRASVEQRWKILMRVAEITAAEAPALAPAPESEPVLPLTKLAAVEPEPRPAPKPTPPAPKPSSAPRRSAPDFNEQLFEAMHLLSTLPTAAEAARHCLDSVMRAVPCLGGLLHLRDPATRDLVVVHALGPRADRLLGERTPQSEPLVARAARAQAPIVVTFGSEAGGETEPRPRHALFDPWSVVVVPVARGGQLLGLIEMVDPTDGAPFTDAILGALGYAADHLAAHLAQLEE
jgi:hypothetical protein